MIHRLRTGWRKFRGFLSRFVLLADENRAVLSPTFWQKATLEQVERCIAAGAEVNARGVLSVEDGWTPLHQAAGQRW